MDVSTDTGSTPRHGKSAHIGHLWGKKEKPDLLIWPQNVQYHYKRYVAVLRQRKALLMEGL